MTTIINKRVSSDRERFLAGQLDDQNITLSVDYSDTLDTDTSMKVSVTLRAQEAADVPSNIAAAIVDNNRIINHGTFNGVEVTKPHVLASVSFLPDGKTTNETLVSEVDVVLVDGVPNLSLSVSSNEPTLTDWIQVSYKVMALESK